MGFKYPPHVAMVTHLVEAGWSGPVDILVTHLWEWLLLGIRQGVLRVTFVDQLRQAVHLVGEAHG